MTQEGSSVEPAFCYCGGMSAPGRPRQSAPPAAFVALWGSQSLSLLTSGATAIALSLWVYDRTGEAVYLGLIVAVKTAVAIYASPLLGVLVDLYPRKRVIVIGNLGLVATGAAFLMITAQPTVMLLPLLAGLVLSGGFESLVVVGLAASVRDVWRSQDLTRANGLTSLLESMPMIAAPLLGSLMWAAFGIGWVLVVDIATYLVAGLFAFVTRWQQEPVRANSAGAAIPFRGAIAGFRMIWAKREFRVLQICLALSNLFNGLAAAGVTAFILGSGPDSSITLGAYNAAAAVGLVVGAAVVSAIGARLHRRAAVLGGSMVSAVGGRVLFGLVPIPALWVVTGFLRSIGLQFSNTALTAIWQEATARSYQGRIFGARRMLAQGFYPVAVFVGGAIAGALSGAGHSTAAVGYWLAGLGLAEAVTFAALGLSGVLRNVEHPSDVFIGAD